MRCLVSLKALVNLPEWKQLEAPHAVVHQRGTEAARLHGSRPFSEAVEAV